MTFINFNNTQNSISNKVTYDEKTGGRLTRPENINGNWNVNSAFMFNTPLDSAVIGTSTRSPTSTTPTMWVTSRSHTTQAR